MSNADFQARLQRIGAQPAHPEAMARSRATVGRPAKRKPSYGLMAAGAFVMALGLQVLKFANTSYEAIRDSVGIGAAAGLGLAGMAILVSGIVMIFRAVSQGPDASTAKAYPRRTASKGARVTFSLLGFAFGTIACLYLVMAAAARFIETQNAQHFSSGGILIALFLGFVSLLFGLAGLFIRGRSLWRVPFYFLVGGAVTFAAVRLFGINMLEWQLFVDQLR